MQWVAISELAALIHFSGLGFLKLFPQVTFSLFFFVLYVTHLVLDYFRFSSIVESQQLDGYCDDGSLDPYGSSLSCLMFF